MEGRSQIQGDQNNRPTPPTSPDAELQPSINREGDSPWNGISDQRLQEIARVAFRHVEGITSFELTARTNGHWTTYAFDSGKFRVDFFGTSHLREVSTITAFDGDVFYMLRPRTRLLVVQNGFSEKHDVNQSIYPFGHPNPMVLPYSWWLFEKGERHYWSAVGKLQRWVERFQNAQWIREEKREGLTLSVVDFYRRNGVRLCTIRFARELGFYPIRSDFFNEELGTDEIFVDVERYKQVESEGDHFVVPLRVNFFFREHFVDEDSIHINRGVDPDRFKIERLDSYYVRDLDWASNIFRDSRAALPEIEKGAIGRDAFKEARAGFRRRVPVGAM